jgi:hypothetical protein
MPERRRKYTPEFKDEAAKMVIETSRPIAEVAREIGVNEGTLGNWVANYRKKAQRSGPCHQPQSGAFSQVRRLSLTPFSVARPVFGLISGAPLTRNNCPVWGWWHGPERWALIGGRDSVRYGTSR